MSSEKDSARLDLWLWAARFFKTRAQAQKAIKGGKVSLNGQRVKPAKPISVGDRLVITKNELSYTIDVSALSEKRLKAALAEALYEETPQSRTEREERIAARKAEWQSEARPMKRPDKRQRRQLRAMTRGD